jgi:hypothetical protein
MTVGSDGVVGEQADRVVDQFGGRREGRAHRSGGFHDGANRAVGSDGGGAEEQPRAPARRSRELPTLVRSLGWCRGVQRGTRVAFRDGSTMVAQWHSGGEGAEEEKGCSRGGVLLL